MLCLASRSSMAISLLYPSPVPGDLITDAICKQMLLRTGVHVQTASLLVVLLLVSLVRCASACLMVVHVHAGVASCLIHRGAGVPCAFAMYSCSVGFYAWCFKL